MKILAAYINSICPISEKSVDALAKLFIPINLSSIITKSTEALWIVRFEQSKRKTNGLI